MSLAGIMAVFSTVQAYNRATKLTTEASMPTPRYTLASATGPNGLLYVFGGDNGTTLATTVEAYNPATKSGPPKPPCRRLAYGRQLTQWPDLRFRWEQWQRTSQHGAGTIQSTILLTIVAPLPIASYALAAVAAANGLIYVFGGMNGTTLNTVEAFNPVTNTWTTALPMPTASALMAAESGPNGLLYVLGGSGSSSGSSVLNAVQAYQAPGAGGSSTATVTGQPNSPPSRSPGSGHCHSE